jgi:hypothetical protein
MENTPEQQASFNEAKKTVYERLLNRLAAELECDTLVKGKDREYLTGKHGVMYRVDKAMKKRYPHILE